jgi:hypothetical protein
MRPETRRSPGVGADSRDFVKDVICGDNVQVRGYPKATRRRAVEDGCRRWFAYHASETDTEQRIALLEELVQQLIESNNHLVAWANAQLAAVAT